MNWDYCTHVPMLYEATRVTSGDVVELGVGLCSTPLLHALVTHGLQPRQLYSIDDDASWISVMRSRFNNDKHEFLHVTDWEKQLRKLAESQPSLVFVDNGKVSDTSGAKQLRMQMIRLFRNAEVLVIHDYSNVLEGTDDLPHFKYKIVDQHTKPTTLWLSQTTVPEFLLRR